MRTKGKDLKLINIAIDGPSAAGKSTLAKELAKRLGYLYVDTGALYRTVGLAAYRSEVDPHAESPMTELLSRISITMDCREGVQHVYLNGEDVSSLIRSPEMSMYASAVSALAPVRAFLLNMQRDTALKNNTVMDGRDIGTVILPNAAVKIFLSASAEHRAQRRYRELTEKGVSVTYEDVLSDMKRRDENDAGRALCPAVPASDAVLLDNSYLDFEQTVDAAMNIIESRLGSLKSR